MYTRDDDGWNLVMRTKKKKRSNEPIMAEIIKTFHQTRKGYVQPKEVVSVIKELRDETQPPTGLKITFGREDSKS
ncbi:hypothetical protein RCL_jg1904.t1 [Rhizophagus clarus]|uniref:Uncharacterized protein n=1 Tax=Rhizophagus clarus TaxID=94130 RepID=A0A8H3M077_9GLOM|nr:hypothetical protein RCL_jg1904.t1 [Rhizophagus clarus]